MALHKAPKNEWMHIANEKANKNGPHRTIFTVQDNKKYLEARRMKMDPNKTGISPYCSGDKYSGDWKNNKKHGFGVLTYANSGGKYEGYWENDERHGTGTLWEWRKKKLVKRYTGNWVSNMKHGVGVYYFDSGNKYEGEWSEDKIHGRGTMEYANGDIYEGDWEDNQRCGIGVLLLANGDRFEGSFFADQKEGPGRFFYISTKKIYEGEWLNDMAKCGTYGAIPAEYDDDGAPAEYRIELPTLGLLEPYKVIDEAIDLVESKRDRGVVSNLSRSNSGKRIFSADQMIQLKKIFQSVDYKARGFLLFDGLIDALRELGLDAPRNQIVEFLDEIGLSQGCELGLDEFLKVVLLLRVD